VSFRDVNSLLHELPKPPGAKQGWPWMQAPDVPDAPRADGDDWPRMAIVTPSYNQGEFIEETIRSVLLQGYPNLQYAVIDGGSSDDSVTIIRKYERWLTYWVSEPDRGQSHAINKGFEHVSGEIIGWLNSDDLFLPNALYTIAQLARTAPDAVGWVGATEKVDREGQLIEVFQPRIGNRRAFANWWKEAVFFQPGCLFRRELFEQVGKLHEHMHYFMDADLWMRLADRGEFCTTDQAVAQARMYPGIKSWEGADVSTAELIAACINVGECDIAEQYLLNYGIKMQRDQFDEYLKNGAESVSVASLARLLGRRILAGLKRRVKNVFSPKR
jgi:glycosyltransferase involved in cell wall biosynthesis